MKKTVLLLVGGLLMATAGQAQWVKQSFVFTQPTNVALYTDAVNENVAWALSSGIFNGLAANEVARTFDGGQNWTVRAVTGVNPANENIQSLSAVSATTAWVVTIRAAGNPGRIFKTTDAGATWVQQGAQLFAGEESFPNTIHFFNENDGVVLGDPEDFREPPETVPMEIYYTSNGGNTWTRSQNVPIGTPGEFGTFFPPAVFGNAIWIQNDEGDVFRSFDKGVTWSVTRKVEPDGGVNPDPIELLAFRDASNGLAVISDTVGINHRLLRTSDGGVTWVKVAYSGPLRGVGLDNIPGTNNYISVGINSETEDIGSSYSTDNGQTWRNIESNIPHLFVDAASATAVWSGSVSFTLNEGDGVNKLTSTVLPNRTAVTVAGASLQPNPSADGAFRLQWPAGAHQGDIFLTVTDAVGRQLVHRTLNASRSTEATLDLSRQKPGIYQVKLESVRGVSHLRAQVQ